MTTICPNCLRPVRPGAKFCGFCGSSLTQKVGDEGSVVMPVSPESGVTKEKSTTEDQTKTGGRKARRTVLMVIIILLCLVLLAAFSAYYFQLIG